MKRESLGEPLIKAYLRQGEPCSPKDSLHEIRIRVAQELSRLPELLHALKQDSPYPVEISDTLKKLTRSLDRKNQP